MSESIRFNAAACHLARDIYEGRILAFDLHGVPAFEDLDHTAKALWIQQAQELLNANRPPSASSLLDSFAGLTRAHAAKVIGAISPSEPYGVSK